MASLRSITGTLADLGTSIFVVWLFALHAHFTERVNARQRQEPFH